MSGMNLLAEPEAPQAPRNLLADEAPQGVNLLEGIAAPEKEEPGFLDHMGSLLSNSPMIGTIQPDMVPSRITDQMAVGAANTVNDLELAWRNRPEFVPGPNHMQEETGVYTPPKGYIPPDRSGDAERVQQLLGNRRTATGVISEIQQPDNAVAKMAGDAMQSVPGSVAGMVPALVGLPLAPAVAAGLATNYALEASSDYNNRVIDLGQGKGQAWEDASLHGAVATALETLPLHGAVKYMKGAAPLGKTALKIGVGEAVQEGATQLFDDVATNARGLTDLSLSEMAANAGTSAIQGMMMAPVMGGVAHTVRKAGEVGRAGQVAQLTMEQVREKFDGTTAPAELAKIFAEAEQGLDVPGAKAAPVADSDLTPVEIVQAEITKAQMKGGIDVEATPEGAAFGSILDLAISPLQESGATISGEGEVLDEGGVTAEVAEGRAKRYAPNELPASKRLIRAAAIGGKMQENVLGLTPEQTGEFVPGSVVALGGTEDIFPTPVYSRLTEDLSTWVAKYMPEARIVLNLEQFAPEHQGSAFGLHNMQLTPKGMLHVITPRDLPGFKYQGGDQKTQVALLTGLSHEFGHALKVQSLYQGITEQAGPQVALRVLDEVKAGKLQENTMAALQQASPEAAGMIGEWSRLRDLALSGKMTAQEFMDSWAGLRKLGADNYKTKGGNKSLYTWAKDRLAKAGKAIEGATAEELITAALPKDASAEEKLAYMEDYLSLDEYMAEQFSRASYDNGDLQRSAGGQLFYDAMQKLKQLFIDLKSWKGESGERIIQPGTTFSAWLDAQTARAKRNPVKVPKSFKLSKEVKAAQKLKVKARLTPELQKVLDEIMEEEVGPEAPAEQVPVPADIAVTAEEQKAKLNEWITEAHATGAFYGARMGEDSAFRSLKGMIERGQLENARQKLADAFERELHWDLDTVRKAGTKLEHPEISAADVAGLSAAEFRTPKVMAQAADMWKRLKFESPFFKRWGGNTKVLGADGKPLQVWRGTRQAVDFLDPTTRGKNTGVSSARNAFWFTDNKVNAAWYADKFQGASVMIAEHRRTAQTLRRQLEDARTLIRELPKESKELTVIMDREKRLYWQLAHLEERAENKAPAQPVVQPFYLNMENPLVVDLMGEPYDNGTYSRYIEQAKAEGYDGVILQNTFDPLAGTVYGTFAPEQAKLETNLGTFDKTDELHWDKDSTTQQATRQASKMMENFWEKAKLASLNSAAKAMDYALQLQQVAASQPDDIPLSLFMTLNQKAMQMKNNLQVDAELLMKKMKFSSPATVTMVQKVMMAERKGEVLQSTLVGKGIDGTAVWGGGQPTTRDARRQVHSWEVQDSLALRAFMEKQGVDLESSQGKKVVEFYLAARNVMLKQFTGLEIALKGKVQSLYENAPTVYKSELSKIDDLMAKLRGQPFMPQGNFGNHVVVVLKKAGPGRAEVIRREHFESQAEAQLQSVHWQKQARGDSTLRVKTIEIQENDGIPLQLPQDMLETLAGTGAFTDEQIDTMAEVMLKSKHDKIADRFEKLNSTVDGGNQDFLRVFANFSLRNANYVWKLYFRTAMNGALSGTRSQIRQLERDKTLDPKEQMLAVRRQRRNLRMMERSLSYLMHPPSEFQRLRLTITMMYLAFGVKTAVVNLSTQINTAAAAGSEYGEWNGAKGYSQALLDTAGLFWIDNRIKYATGKEAQRLNEIKSVYDRAVREGVLDQTYAYYLAGQANMGAGLISTGNSWMGRVGHAASEIGMFPFQTVEKANRISSLFTFYGLERKAGSDMKKAYEAAVSKTSLLQFNYDGANKAELLRGKKSVLFMFASYTLSMGWILTGGYERGVRAQRRAEGRAVPNMLHGTTMKLWLAFLMLGGISGVPFAENVMDLIQYMWRKVFGHTDNVELELRNLIKDVGGDPNLVMHGLLHDAWDMDLSGSFGFGRPIPGTDLLNRVLDKPSDAIGAAGLKFMGPAGGFFEQTAKAVMEGVDGNFLEAGKNLPGASGAISKALDAYLVQKEKPTYGVTTKSNVRLTFDENLGEFRDLTTGELLKMAMGAQPSIVSQNRDMNYTVLGETLYWGTRRSDLMDKFWKAYRTGDKEMRGEVLKEIDRFNHTVPDNHLRVTGKDRALSIKTRTKAAKMGERFGTASKKLRGIARAGRDSFQVPDAEGG